MDEETNYKKSVHRGMRSSLIIKLLIIGFLIVGLLILTIPLFVVIDDRENRRYEVVEEISSKWGRDQTIIGPFRPFLFTKH